MSEHCVLKDYAYNTGVRVQYECPRSGSSGEDGARRKECKDCRACMWGVTQQYYAWCDYLLFPRRSDWFTVASYAIVHLRLELVSHCVIPLGVSWSWLSAAFAKELATTGMRTLC